MEFNEQELDLKTLYLVRHGTVYNPESILYRRLPGFVLSEQGRAEAAQAGEFLRHEPLRIIYHSPLERARETAGIVNGARVIRMQVDERIHEWAENEKPLDVRDRMLAFFEEWRDS